MSRILSLKSERIERLWNPGCRRPKLKWCMPKELLLLYSQATNPLSDEALFLHQTRSPISPRVLQHKKAELPRPSTEIVDAQAAFSVSGSLVTSMTRGVQLIKDFPAMFGIVAKLTEKGRQQATDIPLRGILEVKVVIRDQRRPGLNHALDIFNNGGADAQYQFPHHKEQTRSCIPKDTFPCSR